MQTTFRASIDFRVKATVAICIFFAKSVSKDITCYPIFKIPNFGSWNSSAFQTSRVALNVTSFKCIYLNSKIMSLLRQNTLCNCKHFKNVHFITKSTERELSNTKIHNLPKVFPFTNSQKMYFVVSKPP